MELQDPATTVPTVIVVDNDAALVGALKFSLELEGFKVRPFRSAAELLAEKDLPNQGCLVVEFSLGGMNGLDLVDELRKRSVHLPAVLTTSHATPLLRTRARAAGMRVVEKPLLGNGLLNAINRALSTGPLN